MNDLERKPTLRIAYILSITVVPVLAVGILYETFLGHRHDYTGHFAAGYGGTLGAMMVMFRVQSGEKFTRWGQASVVLMCIACIRRPNKTFRRSVRHRANIGHRDS